MSPCLTKLCPACNVEKLRTEFHRRGDSVQARCKVCRLAHASRYYLQRAAEINARAKRWRDKNRDLVLANHREYYEAHKDEYADYQRAFRRARPDIVSDRNRKRSALRRGAPVCDLTAEQWVDIQREHDYRCKYCGGSNLRLTQDHVVPLSRGGAHTRSNIVPACNSCNSRKKDKLLAA